MGKIPVHEASLQVEKLFDEFAKICELQNLSSNQSSLTFTEDEQCEKRSIHADLDGKHKLFCHVAYPTDYFQEKM